MKKVTLPIYIKLVFFILLIVIGSLSSYVYFAVDTFLNDKVSYVYEAVDDFNDKSYFRLKAKIENIQKDIQQVASLNFKSQVVFDLLKKKSSILAYFEIEKNELGKVISYKPKNEFPELYKTKYEDLFKKNINYLPNKIIFAYIGGGKKYGVIVNKELFFKQPSSSLYSNSVIANMNTQSITLSKIIKELTTKNRYRQSFKTKSESPLIVSARKYSEDLIIISTTDYNKAIAASKNLRHKSLYFGGLVIGIVIILVLLLAQFFTRPLNKLTIIVNGFLSSDFKTRSDNNSRDEIGFLANSFNKMADDINIYMIEMEEKLRIEEELKTAKIVQSQFFPHKNYKNGPCNIYGIYQSATECGGDWWGVLESKDSTALIISDVTGHGTPAALMTAVLHSSLNSLEFLSSTDSEYMTDSSKIMSFLNTSFSKSTSKLNATAFVICIDHTNLSMNYTNASHNPPFYFQKHKGQIEKSDIIPLIESIGPRLGEANHQIYSKNSLTLQKTDKLFFYTDGILEGENIENKQYGQRKFIKQLLNNQDEKIDDIINKVVNDFRLHTENSKLGDDYTVVGLELN